jgi:hypothetical protein
MRMKEIQYKKDNEVNVNNNENNEHACRQRTMERKKEHKGEEEEEHNAMANITALSCPVCSTVRRGPTCFVDYYCISSEEPYYSCSYSYR